MSNHEEPIAPYPVTLEQYPVYQKTRGNSIDLRCGGVRQRSLTVAKKALQEGMPLNSDTKDYLLQHPEILGSFGLDTLVSIAPPNTTIAVENCPESYHFPDSQVILYRPSREGTRTHNGQAIVRNDYNGTLGGGTPQNSFRIPGLIHQ